MSLVEKGDIILINTSKKEEQVIEWSQDFGDERKASYFSMPYVVKGKQAAGVIFVSVEFVDKFYGICQDTDKSDPLFELGYNAQVQVNDDFQYGQDEEKTNRFLVYHNKDNKPYQHRFTGAPGFVNAIQNIVKLGTNLPIPYIDKVDKIIESFKSLIGDELRNF